MSMIPSGNPAGPAPAVSPTPVVDPVAAARTAATVSWLKSQWMGVRLALSVLPIIALSAALSGRHIGLVIGAYALMILINALINPNMAKVMLAPSLTFIIATVSLSNLSLTAGLALSATLWWVIFAFSKNPHLLALLGKIPHWAIKVATVGLLANFLFNEGWLRNINLSQANFVWLIIGSIAVLLGFAAKCWLPTLKKMRKIFFFVGAIVLAIALVNWSKPLTLVAAPISLTLGQWQWEALLLPLMTLLTVPETLGVVMLSAQKDSLPVANIDWKKAVGSAAIANTIAAVTSPFCGLAAPTFAVSSIGVPNAAANRKPFIAAIITLALVASLGFIINLRDLVLAFQPALAVLVVYYLFKVFFTQVWGDIFKPFEKLIKKQPATESSWLKAGVLVWSIVAAVLIPTIYLTDLLAPITIRLPVIWLMMVITVLVWAVKKLKERTP